MIKKLTKIYAAMTDVLLKIACVFLFFALAVVFIQVVLRFTLGKSIYWADEASRFAMIAAMALGVCSTARLGRLPRVSIIYERFPPVGQKILDAVFSVTTMALTGILTTYGVQAALSRLNRTGITIKMSMAIMYGLVPLCCGMLFLNALINLLNLFEKNEGGEVK